MGRAVASKFGKIWRLDSSLRAVMKKLFMINLEHTEQFSRWDKHKTWTKTGDEAPKISPLQNQFALHEFQMSEEEALAKYRAWLWGEMQDGYNVVGKEMQALVRAHLDNQAVAVLVPKAALHGPLIVNALRWLADQLPPAPVSPIRTAEPGPCYEPILPDGVLSTRAEIEANHLVWVQGHTSSRLGVIVGYNEVLVPGYGVLPLKQFRWASEKLAASPLLQAHLNDELDELFNQEANATPVEYDPAPPYDTRMRFDSGEGFWAQTVEEEIDQQTALAQASRDTLTQVEALAAEVGDLETALELAAFPEVEGWYAKRPPTPSSAELSTMRTVYKYTGEHAPLMVKAAEEQLAGKSFRYATQQETAAYRQTFRHGDQEAGQTTVHQVLYQSGAS